MNRRRHDALPGTAGTYHHAAAGSEGRPAHLMDEVLASGGAFFGFLQLQNQATEDDPCFLGADPRAGYVPPGQTRLLRSNLHYQRYLAVIWPQWDPNVPQLAGHSSGAISEFCTRSILPRPWTGPNPEKNNAPCSWATATAATQEGGHTTSQACSISDERLQH